MDIWGGADCIINDKPINIQLTLFIGSNKSQFITFERFPGFYQS